MLILFGMLTAMSYNSCRGDCDGSYIVCGQQTRTQREVYMCATNKMKCDMGCNMVRDARAHMLQRFYTSNERIK